MLTILTHSPSFFSTERLKSVVKKLIKKSRGPEVALKNLLIGLDRINYPYQLNTKPKKGDVVHVMGGINALRWAIRQKETGCISELIAGPNIVITPLDHNSILSNPHIDKIVVVSKWTEEFFRTLVPGLKDKLYIWPAGVECPVLTETIRGQYLIYKKYTDEVLFKKIQAYLKMRSIPYEIIEYGSYEPVEYYNKLSRSKAMIYLQESESQGIALQEAWARNVPTLVWNKKLDLDWNKQGYVIDPIFGLQIKIKSSAPYLTKEAGEFFTDYEEFVEKFDEFDKKLNLFTPADYCRRHLSIEKSTEAYVSMIGLRQ